MKRKLIAFVVALMLSSFADAGSDTSPEALCDFYNHLAADLINAAYKNITQTYTETLEAMEKFNKSSQTLDVLLGIHSPWSNANYPVIKNAIIEISSFLGVSSDYVLNAVEYNDAEAPFPLSCVLVHLKNLYMIFFRYVHMLDSKASSIVNNGITKPLANLGYFGGN